jgi:hypothetical protein
MEAQMLKTALLVALTLLNPVEFPNSAGAATAPDRTSNMLQACRVMHQEEASVSVSDCMEFLETTQRAVETDWVPPFCRALVNYEPELFFSLYTSVTDCVVHNKGI